MRGMEAGFTPADVGYEIIAAAENLLRSDRSSDPVEQTVSSAGVVFERDMITDQVRWAHGFSDLTGCSLNPETALARWWKAQIHPEDQERHNTLFEAALRGSGTNYCSSYRFRHKEGRWLFLRENGVVERHNLGWPLRITGFVCDQTPLKEAQDQLAQAHKLLERITTATPDLLYLYDLNARRNLYANREMGRVLGYSSSELSDMGGSLLTRIIHPEDLAQLERYRDRIDELDDGQVFEHEYRVRAADGSYRWLRAREVIFARSKDGRPSHVVGLAQDITEHKDRETQLTQSEAALRDSDHRKDQFLAMLSHELRNPLAPITTALEVLAMRGAKEAQRELSVIERQVRYLERLIHDLLDVSRVTQGKIELQKETLELADVIGRSLELTAPLFEKKQQWMHVEIPPEGLLVHVDPVRLSQVFTNVLTNAARYTNMAGQISITSAVQGQEAVVRIRDSGTGMPPELVPKVFELFVQGAGKGPRGEGGLGLGLPIARRLVELHGGSIEASSEGPGKGSQFVIKIPLVHAVKRPKRSDASPGAQQELPLKTGLARRILVVDDNQDAAEMLAEALQMDGHLVEVAFDGPQVIGKVRAFDPEIVLMDIGLPGMDGYEVAKQLRADPDLPKQLRLVALTGFGHDDDRQQALRSGFDDHLVKPISLEKIYRLVRN